MESTQKRKITDNTDEKDTNNCVLIDHSLVVNFFKACCSKRQLTCFKWSAFKKFIENNKQTEAPIDSLTRIETGKDMIIHSLNGLWYALLEDNKVLIKDIDRMLRRDEFTIDHPVKLIGFSPDSKWLVCALEGAHFPVIYDINEKKKLSHENYPNLLVHACSFGFTDDSTRLAIGTEKGDIFILNMQTNKISSAIFGCHDEAIVQIGFIEDDQRILSITKSYEARTWKVQADKKHKPDVNEDDMIEQSIPVDENNNDSD